MAGVLLGAGVLGKTALFRATIQDGSEPARIALTAVVILGGLLSLVYMFQSYGRTYWHASTAFTDRTEATRTGLVLVVALRLLVAGC